ncbi:hypothetical protein F5Y19DRAFT_425566 [Xylariaceae sp. FL1651]|nr:hypothetical protein F5Y19DRAFT_425566 [Xylariaceae sp. FL1651]
MELSVRTRLTYFHFGSRASSYYLSKFVFSCSDLVNAETLVTNGKYRCNICHHQVRNTKPSISSHNSKFHPVRGSKSAYIEKQANVPAPCMYCTKMCRGANGLISHLRQRHGLRGSAARFTHGQTGSWTQNTNTAGEVKKVTLMDMELEEKEVSPEECAFWRSLLPHDQKHDKDEDKDEDDGSAATGSQITCV